MLELRRPRLLAVVQGEGADHPSVARLDRNRPACLQPQRQGQVLVIGPQRIGVDLRHDDRGAAKGGRAAGADIRADRQTVEQLHITVRQAGCGQRADTAFLVDAYHRGDHVRCNAFDLQADALGHFADRQPAGHGFQDAVLQQLQLLGFRNIGQYRNRMLQTAILADGRIDHGRDPGGIALLAVQQQFFIDALRAQGSLTDPFQRFPVGFRAGEQMGRPLAAHLLQLVAEQRGETTVHELDLHVPVADDDRVVGFMGNQGQQVTFFAQLHVGTDVADESGIGDFLAEPDLGQRHAAPERGAVLAFDADFAPGADNAVDTGIPVAVDQRIVDRADVGRYQQTDVPAQHLVATVTPKLFSRGVEEGDPVSAVNADHGIDGLRQRLQFGRGQGAAPELACQFD